jgi:hypothetical protein
MIKRKIQKSPIKKNVGNVKMKKPIGKVNMMLPIMGEEGETTEATASGAGGSFVPALFTKPKRMDSMFKDEQPKKKVKGGFVSEDETGPDGSGKFENEVGGHKQDAFKKHVDEKWSEKYKKSIDCNNPKGFSQKAHCQGRKKVNEDKLKGGLADDQTLNDIAKKHDTKKYYHVDDMVSSLKKQFNKGIKVEMEHTNDKAKAREIAMDHLWEIKDYYDRLDTMESEAKKYDRIETSPDGKTELDYGKEELNKPGLQQRWEYIKKALDHKSAIMDVSQQEGDDEHQTATGQEDQGQNSPDEQPEQASSQDMAGQQDEGQHTPDEQPNESSEQTVDDNKDQTQDKPDEQPTDVQADTASQQDTEQEGGQDSNNYENEQKIIEALKDEGYSPTEIAYIMHGQAMPEPNLDDEKMSAVKQKAAMDSQATSHKIDMANKIGEIDVNHKKRLSDAEHDHKQKMYEIERKKAESELGASDPELKRTHQQRMLDLEYEKKKRELDFDDKAGEAEHNKALRALEIEKAKQEMALDIEFKKQEMKLKLEEKKMLAAQNKEHKSAVADIKHAQAIQEAKNPEPEKKPLKKK